jgi:hypothetical protein
MFCFDRLLFGLTRPFFLPLDLFLVPYLLLSEPVFLLLLT